VSDSPDIPHLELGHALITMVEPEPATIVEYNAWYERDHSLAGVLAGPGAFAGRRFAATRDLKALRSPEDSPISRPSTNGSFVALYWIERDQLAAHCDWGFPEAVRLASLGRMRTDRQHLSTSYYDLVGATGRGERPVPVELALHHPYDALVMIWTRADDDHETSAASLREALVAEQSPIGTVVTFRPAVLPPPLPAMPGVAIADPTVDQSTVLAHCCFIDGIAATEWPAVLERIDTALAAVAVTPLLVAPFVPTVPGTETHLAELW
jgi:hypothetical protein